MFHNRGIAERNTDKSKIVKISLPFKYQVSAIIQFVDRQLRDLYSQKIDPTLQQVFISRKLEKDDTDINIICDNTLFVASLTQLVSSQPRNSSETFLLGKLVGHRAKSHVR